MNRREFLKLTGMGAMTVFLSGCGLSALTGQEKDASGMAAHEKGEISGGKAMKIVVITSSPHPHDESTSIYLADRFTKGATQAGHEVFTFDAANSETHPCRGCDQCHMDGPCIWKDDIENTLMPKMLEADLLVLTTPLYYFGMSAQLKTIVVSTRARGGSTARSPSSWRRLTIVTIGRWRHSLITTTPWSAIWNGRMLAKSSASAAVRARSSSTRSSATWQSRWGRIFE